MKKTSNNRVLVYSRKSEALLNNWKRLNSHDNNDYDFVSNVFDLTSRLYRLHYKMTIIDGEAGDEDKDLLNAVSIAVASGQPIMIRRLHTGNPDEPTGMNSGRLKAAEKTYLSTDCGGEEDGHINERNIISSVTATLKHRINNPLMAISANVEMILKNNGNLDKDLIGKIEQIGLCAEKIKEVTERLANLESIKFRDTAAGRMIDLEPAETEPENPQSVLTSQTSE